MELFRDGHEGGVELSDSAKHVDLEKKKETNIFEIRQISMNSYTSSKI